MTFPYGMGMSLSLGYSHMWESVGVYGFLWIFFQNLCGNEMGIVLKFKATLGRTLRETEKVRTERVVIKHRNRHN